MSDAVQLGPKQVLIVGAGPAGLGTAIELGSRGIACLLIEQNDRVGYAPRAKTTHTRTREHLRRWGFADKLAAASPLGLDFPSNVAFITRLAGYPLATLNNAFSCAPARNEFYSEHAQWIPQYILEDVLRAHVETLPSVELRFNCQLQTFEQSESGVRAFFRDTAADQDLIIDTQYLVGADGARSPVRQQIGSNLVGKYGLSRNYNIVFRAPGMMEAHQHGPAVMYWQVNNDHPSLIGPMDDGDRWFFMPTGIAEGAEPTDEEAVAMIKKATGIDLPYEILSRDVWVASEFLADKYQDGRVFLVGDACHLHPPFGGYGMNMGVADGVDLGWKMAAVLDGWAAPALLDTYETERRPVHRGVIDEAVANHALLTNQMWQDGLEDATPEGEAMRTALGERIRAAKSREFYSLGVVLGYRYDQSPIVVSDGTPVHTLTPAYTPSSAPGALAPHAWLEDGRSLYDLFGQGYTLLTFGEAADAVATITGQAEAAKIPLTVVTLDNPDLAKLYEKRLILIRPDQHVAWRGDAWPGETVLQQITGRLAA